MSDNADNLTGSSRGLPSLREKGSIPSVRSIDDLIAEYEQDPQCKAALDKARQWLKEEFLPSMDL